MSLTTLQKFDLSTEVDFRDLIYGLWKNKILILVTTLLVVLIASTYTLLKTPQYEANVLIQINGKNTGNLFQFSMGGGESTAAAQNALIKTRFILEPVVNKLGLAIHVSHVYLSFFDRFKTRLNTYADIKQFDLPSSLYGQPFRLNIIDKRHFILENKKGEPLIHGEVNKISTDASKSFSILVTNLKANTGDQFNVIRYSNESIIKDILPRLRLEEIGEGKTGILQISLKDTDPTRLVNSLNAIATETQEKDSERKSRESAKILEYLLPQLPLTKSTLESAESALNHYRATTGKLDIRIESQAILTQLSNVVKEITLTELHKINLLQNYTAQHPFVIELDEKLIQLKKQKLLLEKQIKSLPAADQVMVNLMREVSVKNRLYLTLLSKIQELKVNKAGMISDVRILSLATIPEAPISKQMSIVVIASIILGFILGCIAVLIRNAFRPTINDYRWLEKNLNITNLAIIPFSKQQAKNMHSYKEKEKKYIEILAVKNSQDLALEALRSLRTSLQILLAGSNNNIISLTGVSPSTGKSFISTNFACLLADSGKRVLLIDADIRKGYLNKYFNVPSSPGLSEVLSRNVAFEKTIQSTLCENLSFLPSGAYPNNPSELLMSAEFRNLMSTLSRQYDLVIIDTPPILAVTDSAIIGALAGTNILVVASDLHQSEEIYLAVKRFEAAGAKIHGTLFNYLKPTKNLSSNYQYSYKEIID